MEYPYYLIEHPILGVYAGDGARVHAGNGVFRWTPRFSRSKSRSEGVVFSDEVKAKVELDRVRCSPRRGVGASSLLKMTGDHSSMSSAVLIWRNNQWEPYL